MKILSDTIGGISTVILYAVRNTLSCLRPSSLSDQEKREISDLIKKAEAQAASEHAYTAEEWHAEFVQPLLDARPELTRRHARVALRS